MNYCPTQSIGCMDEPKNERSKLASHVQDCMSSIMYKLTCNDEYTVQEQEDNLLVFLNLIGKVSDLQTIAKKLIEYKAKLEIEDIAEDKKEDDEEKLETPEDEKVEEDSDEKDGDEGDALEKL